MDWSMDIRQGRFANVTGKTCFGARVDQNVSQSGISAVRRMPGAGTMALLALNAVHDLMIAVVIERVGSGDGRIYRIDHCFYSGGSEFYEGILRPSRCVALAAIIEYRPVPNASKRTTTYIEVVALARDHNAAGIDKHRFVPGSTDDISNFTPVFHTIGPFQFFPMGISGSFSSHPPHGERMGGSNERIILCWVALPTGIGSRIPRPNQKRVHDILKRIGPALGYIG